MSEAIGILVIGNPGTVGDISLKSILRTFPNSKLHAMVDRDGQSWLRKRVQNHEILCIHSIEEEDENRWKGDYKSFGSTSFNELTKYKWILILESFRHHVDQSNFLFTDLDIFWCREPSIHEGENNNIGLSFQMDCDSKDRLRFCTGIIFVKRSCSDIIESILNFQNEKFLRGEAIHDEKACNKFIFSNKLEESVTALPRDIAVIGRDFIRTLFWWRRISCFHANYMNTSQKKRALKCLELRYQGNPKWIVFFVPLAIKDLGNKMKDKRLPSSR